METAGTIDFDVEIKFLIGDVNFSYSCDKKQIEQIKDLYKALTNISETVDIMRTCLAMRSKVSYC